MRVGIGEIICREKGVVSAQWSAKLDINRLVETRAIIQAASGYGKSYLLCELIEATHGHIQQIIIDPEGEFSLLRKDHDFVIAAAHGGDALAHPRTAGLLATRLLETKASAILDIYDVKPRERHEFVRNFLTAMMEAPKDLWHPVLVFLDEAHLFCPEKGFGESEATDVVIDLAGRGRKRGFTLVAATQRIGKFNKNALAELNNKFIGSASLDLDVKRAAFELGMQPKDALTALRELSPGEFYVFGPALALREPSLLKADLPKTQLPKAGHRKLVAPPKPTDKIRALLPQLADIPREVEQKAKTEAELRKDLADARRDLEALKRAAVSSLETGKAHIKLKADPQHAELIRTANAKIKRLAAVVDRLMKFIVTIRTIDQNNIHPDVVSAALKEAIAKAEKTIVARLAKCNEDIDEVHKRGQALVLEVNRILSEDVNIELKVQVQEPFKVQVPRSVPPKVRADIAHLPVGNLTAPERRILDAIAWMATMTSKEEVTQTAAAFIAKYTPGSSSFRNPRSALAAKGLIDYASNGDIRLTEAGMQHARFPPHVATSAELQDRVLDILAGPEMKLMNALLDKYPAGMTQADHATECGYTPGSSSYRNPRSKLASLGLLRYEGDQVFAEGWMFL